MEFRALVEILVTILMLLVTSQLVKGFATENCQHDQFVTEFKQTVRCLKKTETKTIDELLKVYKEKLATKQTIQPEELKEMCEIAQTSLKDAIICANPLAKTCFPENIYKLVSEATSIVGNGCDFQKRNDVFFNNVAMQRFLSKTFTVFGPFSRSAPTGKIFLILKLDKQCTPEKTLNEISTKTFPCFKNLVTQMITPTSSNPTSSNSLSMFGLSSQFQDCNFMMKASKTCLVSNDCVSQKEMDFVRDLYFTQNEMIMDGLVQITESIGSFSDIPTFQFDKGLENLKQLDRLVEQYRKQNCKTMIEDFSSSSSSSYFGSMFLASATFSFYLFLI